MCFKIRTPPQQDISFHIIIIIIIIIFVNSTT
jgi:hypothetical protein